MARIRGLGSKSRQQLAEVIASERGVLSSQGVAAVLGLTRKNATRLLLEWEKRGWVKRIRQGQYISVPLESTTANVPIEDPWLVASQIFSPCYIGGWTAAEYWGFTEQIFQSVVVMTSKPFSFKNQRVGEVEFLLNRIKNEMLFGTKTLWKRGVQVRISDPSRTVIDLLNDPVLAGGIRSAEDMLVSYLSSEYFDRDALIAYAEKLNNRTIFKRLGFLVERRDPAQRRLISDCLVRISKGYSQLDPSTKGKHVKRRWGLFLPEIYTLDQNDY